MFDAISILVEVIVHLYNNEYFGYFAIESKQEEFHAYHGYCLQQMLMLHDDEWCRFCELGGLTKNVRKCCNFQMSKSFQCYSQTQAALSHILHLFEEED